MNKKIISLLAAASFLIGATQTFGVPVNITRQDPTIGEGFGAPVEGVGIGEEDEETEPGTTQGQAWDLEAFVVSGNKVFIVGGYNMTLGASGGGGSVVGGMLVPGDLFIKVGGSDPGFAPNTLTPGTVNNSVYGYTNVVDLTQSVGVPSGISSATAFTVGSGSLFDTVVYDQFGANPWRYNSLSTGSISTGIVYTPNASATELSNLGVSTLVGTYHNVLEVDLSFLGYVVAGTNVWFSYTMECGNDSMKGRYSGGFDQVPDATASALLIGLGLAGLSVFGYSRRQS